MDAEKVTEVEMKELAPEVQDDKDVEKGKMEETKGAEAKEEDKKEKEVKEQESNVYSKLKSPTEDIYHTSVPASSSKSNEGAEKGGEVKKEDKKEDSNVYSKLKSPTEDIYHTSVPSSSSKSNEEVEKKAEEEGEKKEKEIEGGNVYSKLKSPTEDIYNPSMPSSSKGKGGKEQEENEEAEDVYSKLNDPSENVYMTAMSSSTAKHNKDVYRRVRLYKKIAAFFIVLSLLLLAVVLALAMKLNVSCAEIAESKCTCELCQTLNCPSVRGIPGCQCSECEDDWEMFENSCYFFSNKRQNWQKSREECQKHGADLVVINNERVQKFLTEDRNLLYWIGCHYSEEKWTWINNTSPTQGYWSNGQPNPDSQGSCALINGGGSDLNNWRSNPCNVKTYYICQIC